MNNIQPPSRFAVVNCAFEASRSQVVGLGQHDVDGVVELFVVLSEFEQAGKRVAGAVFGDGSFDFFDGRVHKEGNFCAGKRNSFNENRNGSDCFPIFAGE